MKYLQAFIWSVTALVVGGCVSSATMYEDGVNRIVGNLPPINQRETVDVGESIVQQFEYYKHFGANFDAPFKMSFGLGQVQVSPADFFESFSKIGDSTEVYYCSQHAVFSELLSSSKVCLQDSDADSQFDRFVIVSKVTGLDWVLVNKSGGSIQALKWRDIEGEKPAYTKTDIATPVESASDYKQELIYQGLSGGSLKVAYREYVDSLARPAFTQVVEYDNQEPPFEIAFKGARITVHSATSNELVYTVTKGLVRS